MKNFIGKCVEVYDDFDVETLFYHMVILSSSGISLSLAVITANAAFLYVTTGTM